MKKIILGAMLLGGLAAQSATAAVRTFEFTATVNSVFDVMYQDATTIDGPVAGTTVTAGDLLKGRFSFDDLGRDWTGATTDAYGLPTFGFSYTFLSSNATVSFSDALWHHEPNAYGSSTFSLRESDFRPALNFVLEAPVNGFSWQLGNGVHGSLNTQWSNGMFSLMSAEVTGLTEVSPVPEPTTYAMLLLGAAVVAGAAKRRKDSASA